MAEPSGRSSNGKTADSGSAYRGSNPCLPALNLLSFFFPITYKTEKTLGVHKIQKVDTKRFLFRVLAQFVERRQTTPPSIPPHAVSTTSHTCRIMAPGW